jgi:periplasmic protein TonB
MRWPSWALVAGIAVHVGVAGAIASIPRDVAKRSMMIAVVDKKKKKDDPRRDEPPPPPKPATAPRAAPRPKPAPENTPPPPPVSTPTPAAAAHPALAALPDLGISMAGGPGGTGIAVPMGGGAGPAEPRAVEAAKPAVKPKQEDCTEAEVKPKSVPISQAGIIAAAQTAGGVEGRIRLELQIDESGNVTSVRVMTGLGGAIDEAAVAAAKRAKVSPITRCGRPVAGRMVYAMTIRNPD